MTKRELEEKVKQLEARIAQLEARPVYVPVPMNPAPWQPHPLWPQSPWWQNPIVTCGTGVARTTGYIQSAVVGGTA